MLGILWIRHTSNALRKPQIFEGLTDYAKCRNTLLYLRFHSSSPYKYPLQIIRSNVATWNITSSKAKSISNVLIKRKHTSNFFRNTDVNKNTLLYEYVDKKMYRLLSTIAVIQNACWIIVAYCAYTPAFWTAKTENITWKQHMNEYGLRFLLVITSLFAGTLISGAIWLVCSRSVKYIVLHKGGRTLTLITYNPIKKASKKYLPVKDVKTTISKREMVNYMPLKVRGERMFYILDGTGKFYDNSLFENTIGMNKQW